MKDGEIKIGKAACWLLTERLTKKTKTPELRIYELTCRGVLVDVIQGFIPLEIRYFTPIFNRFLELENLPQSKRIEAMRDFLKGYRYSRAD